MVYNRLMQTYFIQLFALRRLRVAGLLSLLLAAMPAAGSTVLQNGAIVHLHKTARDQITIDIRLAEPEPITRVTARIGIQPISISDPTSYPVAGQTSAILFMVDTSDPSRQQAVDRAINHIGQILEQSDNHFRFGLARFDTNLHLLSPIGTDKTQLRSKARTLKAVGKTTELYRNTLGAIRILKKYPADRKFLFLLSDGLAEDRAYFHRDVVQSARQNDVSIYTIGYPDTIGRTVALQTLRRLSEDTGGQYLPTSPGSYGIEKLALQHLLNTLDSGIQLKAHFKTFMQSGLGGAQRLDLSIDLAGNNYLLNLPINLPQPPAQRYQQPLPLPAGQQPVQQVILKRVPIIDEARDNSWLLLVVVSLLMMGLIIFLALRLRSGAGAGGKSASQADDNKEAYAWLERIDGTSNERFPIQSNQVKIGRFRGNDVALHDPAVSRYHAEIRFNDDGQFMIADLGSKNGILVNDEEVYEQVLHDLDIIEIGDVRLRFSIQSDFAADMEDTQMFRTQFPPQNSTNH